MNIITLKTDGAIAENGKIIQNDPWQFLSYQIQLEEGYTLRSFLRMCDRYAEFVRLNAFLPDCLQRYRACPKR